MLCASVRVTGRLSARVRCIPEGLAWASLQLLTPAFRLVCCIFAVIHPVAHTSLRSGSLALHWSSSYSQFSTPGPLGHPPTISMPRVYKYTIVTPKSRVWRVSMHRRTYSICTNTPNQQTSENALFTMGDTAVGLPPNIVAISYIPYSIPV